MSGGAPDTARPRSAAASGRGQRLTLPGTTWPSLPRRRRRHVVDGRWHVDGLEVRRADDFQILHVFRVVVEVVGNARPLMHDVAGLYQRRLVLVHEARPALGHDDDLEIAFMFVPAGAFLGGQIAVR